MSGAPRAPIPSPRLGKAGRLGNAIRFQELLTEIADIFGRKNADYGGNADPFANFREAEKLGVSAFLGCLVRMGDKWSRIQTLVAKGEANRAVMDESLADTLRDLATYSLIAICLYEEAIHAAD